MVVAWTVLPTLAFVERRMAISTLLVLLISVIKTAEGAAKVTPPLPNQSGQGSVIQTCGKLVPL